MTTIAICIESISIIKRLISEEIFENIRLFTHIIDLISINNTFILQTLLDFLVYFFEIIHSDIKEEFMNEFGQIFYLGKLIFICEKYEDSFKI